MTFFDNACNRARIRNFHWHCLRHTFASRLAMAGTDLKRIKDAMGHKTITMTDRYSHLQRSAVREAVDSLQPVTLLEAVRPETMRVQ
jgi:site-specific recombinase XerD